jgi:hypothetical protein
MWPIIVAFAVLPFLALYTFGRSWAEVQVGLAPKVVIFWTYNGTDFCQGQVRNTSRVDMRVPVLKITVRRVPKGTGFDLSPVTQELTITPVEAEPPDGILKPGETAEFGVPADYYAVRHTEAYEVDPSGKETYVIIDDQKTPSP